MAQCQVWVDFLTCRRSMLYGYGDTIQIRSLGLIAAIDCSDRCANAKSVSFSHCLQIAIVSFSRHDRILTITATTQAALTPTPLPERERG